MSKLAVKKEQDDVGALDHLEDKTPFVAHRDRRYFKHQESLVECTHKRFSSRLLQYFSRRMPGEADDLLQTVYLKMLNSPHMLSINRLECYVFTIARHALFDTYRTRAQTQVVSGSSTSCYQDPEAIEDFGSDPYLQVACDQTLVERLHALGSLSPRCREVFWASRFGQKPHKVIAEELGITTSMVEKHISKALKHL